MKVQILTLDTSDELASVMDKLSWVQAQRVILVWPAEGRILTRQLDLVLLQRLAARRGFQLGFVSFDPDIEQNARRLGIPLFKSVDEIDEARWRIPRGSKARQRVQRKKPRPRQELMPPRSTEVESPRILNRLGRIGLFSIGVLAVLLLSAAIVPSATIRVKPERHTQTTWISVSLNPNPSDDPGASALSVQTVTVPVSDEARILTSGYRSIPNQPASGIIQFTNLQQQTVAIPTGTGVRSSAIGEVRFETSEAAELDPQVGATVEVPVRANQPGEIGNLEAGSIDSIEGTLGLSLRVTNPEALQGGTSSSKSAVEQRDLDRLKQELHAELLQRADQEIGSRLREDQRLLRQSLRIQEDLNSTYDHSVGDLAESVGLTLESAVTGWVYNTTELENLLKAIAIERLPADSLVIPDTFRIIEVDESISASGDPDALRIRIQQQWVQAVSEAALIQSLRGVEVEEVERIIQRDLDVSGQVLLEVHPSWLPRLPLLNSRYTLVLEGF